MKIADEGVEISVADYLRQRLNEQGPSDAHIVADVHRLTGAPEWLTRLAIRTQFGRRRVRQKLAELHGYELTLAEGGGR